MKQPCPIHIVAVRVSPVLEATGPAPSMHHHPPLEDQQEVVRFLVLHYTHLNRSSTILIIKLKGMDGCSSFFILGRCLCVYITLECQTVSLYPRNLTDDMYIGNQTTVCSIMQPYIFQCAKLTKISLEHCS